MKTDWAGGAPAALVLCEVVGAEAVGVKTRLGCLPDGRRVDVISGAKSGVIYLRVRESQGRKRFFKVVDLRG